MKDKQFWNNLCVYQEASILELMELINDFREEAKQAGKEMTVLVMDELFNKCNLILLQNSVLHHYTISKEFPLTSAATIEINAQNEQ
jgi:hypothetical protein